MSELAIIHGDSVNKGHILDACSLDFAAYPKEYHLSPETCLQYYNSNHHIYTMLQLNDKIIGYLNFSPIDKETYEKLRSGNYLDLCVKPENVLSYKDNTIYYGYFSSIVIEEHYRHKGYAKILLNSLISQLTQLTKRGIYFKRILADVLSPGGAIITSHLGLQKKKLTNNSSIIYEGLLIPNKLIPNEYNLELIEAYNSFKGTLPH